MLKTENVCKLPLGLFFLGLGISSIIYTPFDFIFDIRLRMIPGTPPYQLWADPPENLLMKVYVFNITNSERFLNGSDDTLHVQEVGPIIFREKVIHTNVVFNDNSTLTYTVTRTPVYLPERNTINLNDTMIAPNLGILVMASYLSDSPFFVKASINMLINRYKSQALINTTIYNFLLNSSDPVLGAAKMFTGSSFIHSTNVGILNQMYFANKHNVTVFIGPKYGNLNYFLINNYDGYEHVPGFKKCLPNLINTSETTLFPQIMNTKIAEFRLWKSLLCKVADVEFTNETNEYSMPGFRYDVSRNLFDRTEPLSSDCYRGDPVLPNGLVDISPCYNQYPFLVSFPHFLHADPVVSERIKGLTPDKEKHGSFLVVDKISGVPLGGQAQFQVNLNTNKLSGFNDQIRRFTNMFLPVSYVSYVIEPLPWTINALLYFMSVIIPNTQLIMSITFMAIGLVYLYFVYLEQRKRITENELLACIEAERFLK